MLLNFSNFHYNNIENIYIQHYISKYINKISYIHYNYEHNIKEINLNYGHLSTNSILYPHIHSISRGKWTISENNKLENILINNNINKNIRGWF